MNVIKYICEVDEETLCDIEALARIYSIERKELIRRLVDKEKKDCCRAGSRGQAKQHVGRN